MRGGLFVGRKCGDEMKVISFIMYPSEVNKILE
jgi:hypothetical protein